MRFLAVVFWIAAFVTAPTAQSFGQSADATAVLSAWAEAYASRDGARSAALYTEDASLWGTASAAPTLGRTAIAEYFGRRNDAISSVNVVIDTQEAKALADGTALAFGRYTFRQKRADGTETSLPARYSMVLAKGGDGVWRIVHHHSSPMPRQP